MGDVGRSYADFLEAPAARWAHDDGEADPVTLAVESPHEEIIVDRHTGLARQAGAESADTAFIIKFRERAEASLYVFAKAVLKLTRLTVGLHKPACDWFQRVPPRRKLMLMPRDHLKTSIMRSLAIHILIQPAERNVYFPNGVWRGSGMVPTAGRDIRLLFAGKVVTLAERQLMWIAERFERNPLIRALWPQCTWDNPRRDCKRWSASEILLPRDAEFPEASISTIGVGGAATGLHFDGMLKDDLIERKEGGSAIVMEDAIEWQKTSRALFDDQERGLEWMTGTRWGVWDLYSETIEHDPTVEVMIRSILEDGRPIFPELFSEKTIDELRQSFGPLLFSLLYMNNPVGEGITEFNAADLRGFAFDGRSLTFADDERDIVLAERANAPAPVTEADTAGRVLTPEVYAEVFSGRNEFFRFRSA